MRRAAAILLVVVLGSCEILDATRNNKESARDVKAAAAEIHVATAELREAAARLDQMSEDAAEFWDRWIVPALLVAAVAASAWIQARKKADT